MTTGFATVALYCVFLGVLWGLMFRNGRHTWTRLAGFAVAAVAVGGLIGA